MTASGCSATPNPRRSCATAASRAGDALHSTTQLSAVRHAATASLLIHISHLALNQGPGSDIRRSLALKRCSGARSASPAACCCRLKLVAPAARGAAEDGRPCEASAAQHARNASCSPQRTPCGHQTVRPEEEWQLLARTLPARPSPPPPPPDRAHCRARSAPTPACVCALCALQRSPMLTGHTL